MLELHGVSKRFGETLAVNGVSFSCQRGELVGIIGRSGAGKSTLLRLLNRLADPTEGRITWDGEDVSRLKGRALRQWRRRCAMIFQQFNLSPRLDGVLAQLSPREGEIATRYATGETYSAIAGSLLLSPATVRNHIAHCFRKLGVNNKAELVRRLEGKA